MGMELATTLTSQTVRVGVRETGINPDYWYAVAWSHHLKSGQVIQSVVWQQDLAIYRDQNGCLTALHNVCPHKGVALHRGKVIDGHLACPYHGWEFDRSGQCVNIPYLPKSQKLPCATVQPFPVQEKYGLIWVFPGDPDLASQRSLPTVPEYDQAGWLDVPLGAHFKAHFSICNENSMDVFHGFLHENLQGWFDPILLNLQEAEDSVTAKYQVSYKGWIAKFLGLAERADAVTTLPITVQYSYPHYFSTLEGISNLYLMRLPVGPQMSQSFALFFFRVQLPQWLLEPLKPVLRSVLQKFVLYRFLAQDIVMMESEQQNYLRDPQPRYVEINPAIIAVQRLIVRQYELFRGSANAPARNSPVNNSAPTHGHKSFEPVVSGATAAAQDAPLPPEPAHGATAHD
jgi:renierapurpurin 18,18'-hydroxylase